MKDFQLPDELKSIPVVDYKSYSHSFLSQRSEKHTFFLFSHHLNQARLLVFLAQDHLASLLSLIWLLTQQFPTCYLLAAFFLNPSLMVNCFTSTFGPFTFQFLFTFTLFPTKFSVPGCLFEFLPFTQNFERF